MTGQGHAMKTRKTFIPFSGILAFCMVLLFSHTSPAARNEAERPSERTIKIGICMPVSGELAQVSKLQGEGLRTAHEMTSSKESRKVELVFRDSGTSLQGFSQAMQKLLMEDRVDGVITNVPEDMIGSAGAVMKQISVPFIATSWARPEWMTKDSPAVTRLSVSLEDQASGCAKFMADVLHAHNIGLIVNDKNESSVRLASLFSSAVVKSRGRIQEIVYLKTGEDPSASVTRLMGKKPDAVFIPFPGADIRAILVRIRSVDQAKPVLLGSLLCEEEFLREAHRSLEGVYMQTMYLEELVKSSQGKEFIAYYTKHAQKGAYLGSNIAAGADAYFLALDMITNQSGLRRSDATTASPSWRPYLMAFTKASGAGVTKNYLSFGQIKKNFLGSATLKHVATIGVVRSDPLADVRAQ